MKLHVVRDQAKGLLGGTKFELNARVTLSPDETELIKRYKAEKEVLIQKEVRIPLTGKALVINLTIGSLVSGQAFKCGDIAEIIETENNVKEACEGFKNYLSVMQGFGGEEVIEYT